MKNITLISILMFLFSVGCMKKMVYTNFQADDFELNKVKNRSLVMYSNNSIDAREFKKTFAKEYGTSENFFKKIAVAMKSKLSEVYPEAKIRIDTTEAPDFMFGEVSFSEESQKTAREFFTNLNEDYLFIAKKAIITNDYTHHGAPPGGTATVSENCIVVLEFEIWDAKNRSKVLNFEATGSAGKILFFSGTALKSSVKNAIKNAVKYIQKNGNV